MARNEMVYVTVMWKGYIGPCDPCQPNLDTSVFNSSWYSWMYSLRFGRLIGLRRFGFGLLVKILPDYGLVLESVGIVFVVGYHDLGPPVQINRDSFGVRHLDLGTPVRY